MNALRGCSPERLAGLGTDLYEGCDFGAAPENTDTRPLRDIRDVKASHWLAHEGR
jgi:hypothetical protein